MNFVNCLGGSLSGKEFLLGGSSAGIWRRHRCTTQLHTCRCILCACGSDSLLDLVRPRSFYGSAGRAHHAYTCRAGGLRRGAAQNVYSGLTNVAMTFCGSRTKVWTKPPTVGSECSSGCGWWCSSIFLKGSCRSTFGSIVRKVFCLALGRRILVDGMEVSDWTG